MFWQGIFMEMPLKHLKIGQETLLRNLLQPEFSRVTGLEVRVVAVQATVQKGKHTAWGQGPRSQQGGEPGGGWWGRQGRELGACAPQKARIGDSACLTSHGLSFLTLKSTCPPVILLDLPSSPVEGRTELIRIL